MALCVLIVLSAAACGTAADVPLERAAPPELAAASAVAEPAPGAARVEPPPIAPRAEPETVEVPVAPPPTALRGPFGGLDLPTRNGRFTYAPYIGLGSWLDMYDWTTEKANATDDGVIAMVDGMAAAGVQTLYLQASRSGGPELLLEPRRLELIIARAHLRGMRVVGWYVPWLVDIADDLRRLRAIAALPIEGIAVDIESRKVADPATRSLQLVGLSEQLRAALPGEVIGGIVLEPVFLEDVSPKFWPSFPWRALAPLYDVWLPMAYWTNRHPAGPWRDAARYTNENLRRLRANLGGRAVVHDIGGIGDRTTLADVRGMISAAAAHGAIGGSLYDYRTTASALWPELRRFRAP